METLNERNSRCSVYVADDDDDGMSGALKIRTVVPIEAAAIDGNGRSAIRAVVTPEDAELITCNDLNCSSVNAAVIEDDEHVGVGLDRSRTTAMDAEEDTDTLTGRATSLRDNVHTDPTSITAFGRICVSVWYDCVALDVDADIANDLKTDSAVIMPIETDTALTGGTTLTCTDAIDEDERAGDGFLARLTLVDPEDVDARVTGVMSPANTAALDEDPGVIVTLFLIVTETDDVDAGLATVIS